MNLTLRHLAFLSIPIAVYLWSASHLEHAPRNTAKQDIDVYLPPPGQLITAAGDRYLAANINVFRTFMVGVMPLTEAGNKVVAELHRDAALFNPANEDNYYVAAATLPWQGHLAEAQYVLKRATDARPGDYMPPFLYAFHLKYFEHDPLGAARVLREAAPHIPNERDRLSMEVLAANWVTRSKDTSASSILRAMAAQTKNKAFAKHLELRAQRVELITTLENAIDAWQQKNPSPPPALTDLVRQGYLPSLPKDPLGGQIELTKDGHVVITERQN